jgi:hypothetical protein
MKVLRFYGEVFLYPQGCSSREAFEVYLEYATEKNVFLYPCKGVFPYFSKGAEAEPRYIPKQCAAVEEIEIELLSAEEYDRRLMDVMHRVCRRCVNWIEGENLEEHRENINLDGVCPYFTAAT